MTHGISFSFPLKRKQLSHHYLLSKTFLLFLVSNIIQAGYYNTPPFQEFHPRNSLIKIQLNKFHVSAAHPPCFFQKRTLTAHISVSQSTKHPTTLITPHMQSIHTTQAIDSCHKGNLYIHTPKAIYSRHEGSATKAIYLRHEGSAMKATPRRQFIHATKANIYLTPLRLHIMPRRPKFQATRT